MRFFALLLLAMPAATGVASPQSTPSDPPRWPKGAVILVWIDPANAPPNADALVERAMRTWTNAVEGMFKLQRTEAGDRAAMRVRFVRGGNLYGQSLPRVDERTGAIVRADVLIVADAVGDGLHRRIVTYLTALHEIGHALGLGHNNDFGSIMYSFRLPDDGERYFGAYRNRLGSSEDVGTPAASGLSDRDIETLRALYAR